MYFNPYSDRFDVVCNEEYGFIYTYQSVIGICASQRIRFPLSNKTQCILRRRGRLTRGQFSTHKLHCSASQLFPSMDPNTLNRKLSVIPMLHTRKHSGYHHTLL